MTARTVTPMGKLPPLPEERPDDIRFLTAPPESLAGVTGFQLPRRSEDDAAYHARFKSVHAVVVPSEGEIRIPYIRRKRKGEFSEFMDRLVETLGCTRVRFVNILTDDRPEVRAIRPDDGLMIKDAVRGFQRDDEEWDHYGEDGPVPCLVGDWTPGDPPEVETEVNSPGGSA